MSHNLEILSTGQASMAYRASQGLPWHGLGVPVSDDLSPEEMMDAAGVNWTVSKANTYAKYVDELGNEKMIPTGRQALVRDSDGKVLTEVGKGWNPVQNETAFEFFKEFVDAGSMKMDTAGSMKEGQIVWALADIQDSFTLFGGDQIKGYLLFSNPHIYGKVVDIRFCATRVVCNNTLTMALNEVGQTSVKVNHRAKFDEEKVKEVLGLSHSKMEIFQEKAKFLGSKQYKQEDLSKYFGDIFGTSAKLDKDLSRTAEEVMALMYTQPGAKYADGSWWQAFNAVTYATDHKLGRTNDTRMTSAWFGANAKRKLDALDLALEMANAS